MINRQTPILFWVILLLAVAIGGAIGTGLATIETVSNKKDARVVICEMVSPEALRAPCEGPP